jgi:hypothetical protein
MATATYALRRSYLIYFGGTILVWFAMLFGSFAVLAGSPDRTTELFIILGGAAILFLVGGAAWYVTFGYQSATQGRAAPDRQRAAERERTGLLVYFVGVTVVWLGLVVVTAITLHGTPYFGKELFLLLGLILLWYIIFTPMLIVRDLKRLQAREARPGLPG